VLLQKGVADAGLERTRDILPESFEVAFDFKNMK
jgi:hypothetical protein